MGAKEVMGEMHKRVFENSNIYLFQEKVTDEVQHPT
jgi:hypothetical protein